MGINPTKIQRSSTSVTCVLGGKKKRYSFLKFEKKNSACVPSHQERSMALSGHWRLHAAHSAEGMLFRIVTKWLRKLLGLSGAQDGRRLSKLFQMHNALLPPIVTLRHNSTPWLLIPRCPWIKVPPRSQLCVLSSAIDNHHHSTSNSYEMGKSRFYTCDIRWHWSFWAWLTSLSDFQFQAYCHKW